MKGVIRNMPYEAAQARSMELAAEVIRAVLHKPGVPADEILADVAGKHRMAVSEVKYGLRYALLHEHLVQDKKGRLHLR